MVTTPQRKRRGTLGHRLGIGTLGVLLTLLLAWLLAFITRDIDRIAGPNYAEVEREHVSSEASARLGGLHERLGELEREIARQRERQVTLERSADNARTTMSQLLEIHRLQLEKEVEPSEAEQTALAESERQFLEAQATFQEANARIAELENERAEAQEAARTLGDSLVPAREAARRDYAALERAHRFKLAAAKLGVLLPLLAAAVWLVLARRESPYRVIWLALLVAAAWRVMLVIHEHFPSEVFKYIAIGTGLALVLAALVVLIRRLVRPPREVVLSQHREAYRRHLCPICAEPILRGPLRWARWSRKGPVRVVAAPEALPGAPHAENGRPYVCPSCGTTLFEPCERCGATRHSLLPFCEACGKESEASARPETLEAGG